MAIWSTSGRPPAPATSAAAGAVLVENLDAGNGQCGRRRAVGELLGENKKRVDGLERVIAALRERIEAMEGGEKRLKPVVPFDKGSIIADECTGPATDRAVIARAPLPYSGGLCSASELSPFSVQRCGLPAMQRLRRNCQRTAPASATDIRLAPVLRLCAGQPVRRYLPSCRFVVTTGSSLVSSTPAQAITAPVRAGNWGPLLACRRRGPVQSAENEPGNQNPRQG